MGILQNKVILLTGGSEGIGWECAKAYAAAGARVCIADINEKGATKLKRLDSKKHLFIHCDITREEDIKNCFKAIINKYSRLYAIHNNAAKASPSKPLHTTTTAEWDALVHTNLRSIFFIIKHGIPYLKATKGCILQTSSIAGEIGQENHAAYVATKGAVNALTKAMALDYAPFGIRVNAIAPAAINTQLLQAWVNEQPKALKMQQYLDQLQPLGKMPRADVIADSAVFLLSRAARFITGCILPVSGGAELGYRKKL